MAKQHAMTITTTPTWTKKITSDLGHSLCEQHLHGGLSLFFSSKQRSTVGGGIVVGLDSTCDS